VQVECDGKPIVLPKDTEGILLLNIPSYMGGVDLWASGIPADGHASRRARATSDDNAKQSIGDRRLEVSAARHSSGTGGLNMYPRPCSGFAPVLVPPPHVRRPDSCRG